MSANAAPEGRVGDPVIFGRGRNWMLAAWRGMRRRCPRCGAGALFAGYTRTCETCAGCGLALAGHQADDAPPYVTVMVVGHLIIPLALAVRQIFEPPLALQFAVWIPVVLGLTLWLLPISKGGLIGLQWANQMHGFSDPDASQGEA